MKKFVLWLWLLALALPLLLLLMSACAARWAWPEILPSTFSLQGIASVFSDSTLSILGSSILLSLTSAALTTLLSLPAARALALLDFPGKTFVRALLLLPVLLPSTAYFIGLQTLFTRIRIIDTVGGVILSHCIVILPYTVWTLTDVTGSLGTRLEEQARTLGASPSAVLRQVTLPLLIPTIFSVTALGFVVSFGQYFLTLMIGGGQVQTFAMIVVPFIQSGDRLHAAAYSLAFVAISALVYGGFSCLMSRHYRCAAEKGIL